MRTEIKEVYLRRLRTAPDELVVAYAAFMSDALGYMEQHDVRDCAAAMSGEPPEGGGYGPELNRRDSDILTRVLTSPAAVHPFASEEEASKAGEAAVAATAVRLNKPVDEVLAALAGQGAPEDICRSVRAYLSELARVGNAKPALLRRLLLD
jgi:hypothetical protein